MSLKIKLKIDFSDKFYFIMMILFGHCFELFELVENISKNYSLGFFLAP